MARRGNPLVNFIVMTIMGICLIIFGNGDMRICGILMLIPAVLVLILSKK